MFLCPYVIGNAFCTSIMGAKPQSCKTSPYFLIRFQPNTVRFLPFGTQFCDPVSTSTWIFAFFPNTYLVWMASRSRFHFEHKTDSHCRLVISHVFILHHGHDPLMSLPLVDRIFHHEWFSVLKATELPYCCSFKLFSLRFLSHALSISLSLRRKWYIEIRSGFY